jgi:hypothetical protein
MYLMLQDVLTSIDAELESRVKARTEHLTKAMQDQLANQSAQLVQQHDRVMDYILEQQKINGTAAFQVEKDGTRTLTIAPNDPRVTKYYEAQRSKFGKTCGLALLFKFKKAFETSEEKLKKAKTNVELAEAQLADCYAQNSAMARVLEEAQVAQENLEALHDERDLIRKVNAQIKQMQARNRAALALASTATTLNTAPTMRLTSHPIKRKHEEINLMLQDMGESDDDGDEDMIHELDRPKRKKQ